MARQYSFGGTREGAQGDGPQEMGGMGTKVCPRCGARLFEDMDVCYGCLYDFRNPGEGFIGLPSPEPAAGRAEPGEPPAPQRPVQPMQPAQPQRVVAAPAARTSPDDPGATLAFGSSRALVPRLRVRTPSLEVTLPVGEGGISFGRNPDNDVVLPARTASREHLRVIVRGDEVMAFDQGATNPALLNGEGICGGVKVCAGDVIEMGDVTVRLEPVS